MDVYVDVPPRMKCWLLDFGPWDESTDPGLYQWEELREGEDGGIRVVEEQQTIRPGRFAGARGPLEMTEPESRLEVESLISEVWKQT